MKPPRFTIASLMILVAVAALLIYMFGFAPLWLFFGLLPVLAAIMTRAYRKHTHRATGLKKSERLAAQTAVGLLALGTLTPVIGLRMASMIAPMATRLDMAMAFSIAIMLGAPSFLLGLFILWRLRAERSVAAAARSNPDIE